MVVNPLQSLSPDTLQNFILLENVVAAIWNNSGPHGSGGNMVLYFLASPFNIKMPFFLLVYSFFYFCIFGCLEQKMK